MSSETPDATRFVPWVLTAIAATIGTLWAALQSGRAKEIARLEAALKHEQDERSRERQEHIDQLERLGERLDSLQEARTSDQRKMARVLMMARPEPTTAQSWEEEAPTGVRPLLDLYPASKQDPDLDERLRAYTDTTPPKLKPPRPGGKK